jgi:hypothetical protein
MNCAEYIVPEDYVDGSVFDIIANPPYSTCMNVSSSFYADKTPSFADALYPSSTDLLFEGLNPQQRLQTSWLTTCVGSRYDFFNGNNWTNWTNENWFVPWVCITAYVLALYLIPIIMKDREPLKLRTAKTIWNFSLSTFSVCGFLATSYHLLFDSHAGIFVAGLESSICMHASNYGCGISGLATAAFIYSKCFELIDTVFILLAKREPIFLHWYHHITVLAFCWYAYAVRASNGIYFAVVNYGVHAIMYFYYGMTQYSPQTRKMVLPYAFYITLAQLSQMAFGLMIVGLTVYYKYNRRDCYTYPHVNLFAILMYASYFVLFLEIFLRRYVFAKPKPKKA